DGDRLLPLLGELGPVGADALLVIEPAAGMGDRESHRRQALGCRIDDDHRVFQPRLAGRLVSHAAPQVDDLLPALIDATGAAQFMPPREIPGERVAHGFEAGAYMTFD